MLVRRWGVHIVDGVLESLRLVALAAAAAVWTVNIGMLIGIGHV